MNKPVKQEFIINAIHRYFTPSIRIARLDDYTIGIVESGRHWCILKNQRKRDGKKIIIMGWQFMRIRGLEIMNRADYYMQLWEEIAYWLQVHVPEAKRTEMTPEERHRYNHIANYLFYHGNDDPPTAECYAVMKAINDVIMYKRNPAVPLHKLAAGYLESKGMSSKRINHKKIKQFISMARSIGLSSPSLKNP